MRWFWSTNAYHNSWALFLPVFATLTTLADGQPSTRVIKDTEYGAIQGYVHSIQLANGDQIQVERYLGVPYAAPPVGNKRFELPLPPNPWTGIKNTSALSKACMQSKGDKKYIQIHNTDFDGQMSEDCLYLNIYVPRRQATGPPLMPVLVHVHGGSNEVGMGAMFHGDVLAHEGKIIVVTFNYRLSAFGFLTAPQAGILGNFGLYDQNMALRWLQGNIAKFGGDPNKVTVQGHSAGGVDVGHQVLSPLSKGLFRSAILQSGSPLAFWAVFSEGDIKDTNRGPGQHLQELGCDYGNDADAVKKCLQAIDVKVMADAQYKHAEGLYNFSPTVDGHFIVSTPIKRFKNLLMSKERPNGQTFMGGVVRDEGSFTAEVIMKDEIQKKEGRPFTAQELLNDERRIQPPEVFDDKIFRNFASPRTKRYKMVPNMSDLSLFVYKPWDDPLNATANMIELAHLAGDATFTAPAVRVANCLADFNSTNVYMYTFDHQSPTSPYPTWMGVPHGEDLFYLFGAPLTGHPRKNYSDIDVKVSKELMYLWGQFVTHGHPSVMNDSTTILPYGANQSYFSIDSKDNEVVFNQNVRFRARYAIYWNFLVPSLIKTPEKISTLNGYELAMWALVGILCILLIIMFALMCCVLHYRVQYRRAYVRQSSTEDTGNMLL